MSRARASRRVPPSKYKTMRFLETKIPAPVIATVLAVCMWFAPGVAPDTVVFVHLRRALIDFSVNLSAFVAIAAFGTFWRARTTINPIRPDRAAVLVTHGIYGLTRNPMYLSLLLLLLAYAGQQWSWGAALGPVAFVAYVNRFQILPEERVLEAKFGSAYADYKGRVRRWI